MEKFRTHSGVKPLGLVIDRNLIDVNEDIKELYITDDETGEEVVCGYEYTTYRFRNYAEYSTWLNERKDATIAEQQENIVLLENCIMELTQIISDMIEVMEV